MREIIHVHLGHCGSQIGLKYWGSISQEHGLDLTGTYTGDSDIQIQGIDVSFKEITDNKYVPRAIFADTDPSSSDLILQSPFGKLFKPEYMVKGQEGTGSNFARALYTDGADVSEEMMELIRQEAEKSETLQGFQVTHALGGGTGSGFSYKLFDSIRSDIAVSTVIQDYAVFPAEKICDSAVEVYNVVLALPELYFNPEIVHVLDNEALYDIASRNLVSRSPNNDDVNEIIGAAMAGVTSNFRFPGQINSSMKKFASNLTYFYRMHFYMTEYAPLAYGLKYSKSLCASELIKQLFNGHNVLCSISPKGGKYFTAAINFRGNISAGEAEDELAKVRKQSGRFMDWIPDNFHASYCDVAPVGFETAATLVSNSSAIAEIFKEIKRKYTPLYKRKAYLHWYTCEGMDEMEFRDAEGKLDDCITEHAQWSEERGNDGNEYDSDYVY